MTRPTAYAAQPMNRPAAAWFAGLLVGAATATAAWVRLAGHPVSSAATRAQLAAIQACIRALEALPTRPGWDDEDGTPSYTEGGYIPGHGGALPLVRLDPNECLFNQWFECVRPGHHHATP